MNENCKYCKTSKTCLENADYGSIYCQLHKRIPKVISKTYEELQEENQQLKEQLQQKEDIINKAKEYINENADIYLNIMGNKVGFFNNHNDGWTPVELLEILDNKGE